MSDSRAKEYREIVTALTNNPAILLLDKKERKQLKEFLERVQQRLEPEKPE